jgi:outer membrane protein OmpA-like peptidoglycan-associated protein
MSFLSKSSIVGLAILAQNTFATVTNTSGLDGAHSTNSAYTLGEGSFNTGVSFLGEYSQEGLHRNKLGGGQDLQSPILLSQDFFIGYGLFNWADLSINLPLYQDLITNFDENYAGMGDLTAGIKMAHPGLRADAPFKLTYSLRASFPTGTEDAGYFQRSATNTYLTDINQSGAFTSQGYRLHPSLAWTLDLRNFNSPKNWAVHINLGTNVQYYTGQKGNSATQHSAYTGGLALEYFHCNSTSYFANLWGASRYLNLKKYQDLGIIFNEELAISMGAKYQHSSGFYGSLSAYSSLSLQRNFAYWEVDFTEEENRSYKTQPQPTFGGTLTLGYAHVGKNADQDFDQNPNSTDKCPTRAEDYDGYEDEDGCPDLVHIPVTITQTDTIIVTQRDTLTVIQKDTVQIVKFDTLKIQKEQNPNAILEFGQIVFQSINFQTASSILTFSSFKTLNDIAKSLQNFPNVKIQVLGFTDNTGSTKKNKSLSFERAKTVVDYLTVFGIDKNRMQAVGMGSATPIATNKTLDGRVKNRRVEIKRIK